MFIFFLHVALGNLGNVSPQLHGLSCNFSDRSTDPNGSLIEWGWSSGDGTTSVTRNSSHTSAVAGSYAVKLIARDNDGFTRSTTTQVTVPPLGITLTATGRRLSDGIEVVDLAWSGATSSTVDVYRNDVFKWNTPNDGSLSNNPNGSARGPGSTRSARKGARSAPTRLR